MGQCNGNATFLGTCAAGEIPVCAHICKVPSPENILTALPKKGDIVKLVDSSKLAEVIEIDESRLLPVCVRTLEGRARWYTKERMEYVTLTSSQIERLRAEMARASENEVPETSAYSEAVEAHRNMQAKQGRDEMSLPTAVICREMTVENKNQKAENSTGVSLLDVYAISQKLIVSSRNNEDETSNFNAKVGSNTSAAAIPGVDVMMDAEVHKPVCQADIVPDGPIEPAECNGNIASILGETLNDTSILENDTVANATSDSKVPKAVDPDIEFSEFVAVGTNSNSQNLETATSKQESPAEFDFPCKIAADSEFEFTEFVSAVGEQPATAIEPAPQVCETTVLGIRSDAALSALAELVSSELEKTQTTGEDGEEKIHNGVNDCALISSEILKGGVTIENNLENSVPPAASLKEEFSTSTTSNIGPTSLADKNAVNFLSPAQGAIVMDVEPKMLDVSDLQSSLLACDTEQVSKVQDLVPDPASISLEAPLEEPLVFDEEPDEVSSSLHAVNPASLEHTSISHDKMDAKLPVVNEPEHGSGSNVMQPLDREQTSEFDTI